MTDIPRPPPCQLVVFGANGDLAKRLLVPALEHLSQAGLLGDGFRVLGIDHGDVQHMPALKGDFEDPDLYAELARRLSGNVVFYLAVGGRFFGPIVDRLGAAGLLRERDGAFRRVVIEKPFGTDLASARALNQRILTSAAESQFYLIDHFLGKETVQSVLAIRFANALFEPIWTRDYIDHVQITAAETLGIGTRGNFYEATGALRDMVPNHLFQLLCMIAIEPPASLDAKAVRDAKARLLREIRPIDPDDAVRGQYDGYRREAKVDPASNVETYAALKLMIDNDRWSGVPFYLRTGKCLTAKRTEIAIRLKGARATLFANETADSHPPNLIRIEIDPIQGMTFALNAKVPGPRLHLGAVTAGFRYEDFFVESPNNGYETLLYDCMIGDATLFQRADTIEAGWAAVEPLLQVWAQGTPETYHGGSDGPASADVLLAKDGQKWLPLT